MILAMSPAVSYTIGLLATFLGIGVLVNVVLVVVGIEIASERQQNRAIEEQRVTG
ncbi:MAG: hypothetical protein WCJ63_03175 [Actinomycetes bacterium]